MIGIGQAGKLKLIGSPIDSKGFWAVWSNRKDFSAALFKFFIILFEARQLRAAIRSHESAQESQDHRLAAIIGKPNDASMRIGQRKFRRRFARMKKLCHFEKVPKNLTVPSTICCC